MPDYEVKKKVEIDRPSAAERDFMMRQTKCKQALKQLQAS
jgi:hypothetical protein